MFFKLNESLKLRYKVSVKVQTQTLQQFINYNGLPEVESLTNDNCLQEEKAAAATPAERTHGVVWCQPVWNALVRQVVQETRTKAVSARSQRDPVRTCSAEPTPSAR